MQGAVHKSTRETHAPIAIKTERAHGLVMAHDITDHAIISTVRARATVSPYRALCALARAARLAGNGYVHQTAWLAVQTFGDRPWSNGILPDTEVA